MKNNILNTVRNYKFAIATFTALSLAGGASDAKAATQYWNTSGTAGTWTTVGTWGTSASGPFNTAWVSGSDVVFGGSTAATTTFASTTVGDITVNVNTTISPAGSLTAKTGGSTITVADGVTLSWASQAFASGTPALTKAGNGTWNMGANSTAFTSGFTLNAGTIIISGANSVGTGTFTINGGVVQSSGSTRTANIVLGGDFTNAGTGTDVWSGTVALGSGTRTINNTTTAGSRSYTGIISGAAGAGLTFSGSGTGKTFIGNTGNTFSGPITITGGEVVFNNNGAFGTTTSITLDGGRLTIASDRSGTGIAGATISADKNIYLGSTSGTSISAGGSTGVITYNGVIADKAGSTGLMSKQDLGTLVLGGVSTYTGSTIIGSGTLKLDLGNDRLPTGTVVSLGSSGANLGTFDLNGRNQQIAGLVSKIGTIASGALKNTVTSTTAATLDINVANGQTSSYGAGTTQNSGVITGALALTKSGLGTQVLGDANTYTGGTTVNGGALVVNGSVGAVTVNTGGSLGGSGIVGVISGSGTVGPGNSPGILTATSVNPAAGTDFKFEFTSLSPTYSSATASGNDLLRLTSNSSPFAGGTFASGNIISIYLNSAAITDSLLAGTNTTFSGGFFVDGTYGLAAGLSPASFAYYTTSASLGTGLAMDYNGTSYYLMDGFAAKTTLSNTAVASAGFSTGGVAGTLLTFNTVPEPSTGALLAFGVGGLVVTRLLRRKQS